MIPHMTTDSVHISDGLVVSVMSCAVENKLQQTALIGLARNTDEYTFRRVYYLYCS